MKIDLTEEELAVIYNCIESSSFKNEYMIQPKFSAREKIWCALHETEKNKIFPCFLCRKWFS